MIHKSKEIWSVLIFAASNLSTLAGIYCLQILVFSLLILGLLILIIFLGDRIILGLSLTPLY